MQAGATKLPISLDETNFYLFIFNTTFICLFIFIIYLFISIAHTLNCNLCVWIFWGLLDFSLFSIHVKYLNYSGMYSELWIWYRFPHLLLDPKLDSKFRPFQTHPYWRQQISRVLKRQPWFQWNLLTFQNTSILL
jgi:hypothetical protein